MLQIGHFDLLKVESISLEVQGCTLGPGVYPTPAGPRRCFMLMLWSHKYKLGHIDLIHRRLHNLLKPPENLNFPMCHINEYWKDFLDW